MNDIIGCILYCSLTLFLTLMMSSGFESSFKKVSSMLNILILMLLGKDGF